MRLPQGRCPAPTSLGAAASGRRPSADEASLFGSATLKANDVSGLLAALGLAKPGGVAAPVDLSADLALRGGQLAAAAPDGKRGGVESRRQADLAARRAGRRSIPTSRWRSRSPAKRRALKAEVEGDLSLDRANLAGLFGPMLGAPQSRAADAGFAPPSLDPPPLDLNLRIGALDLGAGQTARRASARLRMDRGRFDLDDVAMDLGGARAAGRLTLRRDAALVAVTGEASIEPVAVDQPALRGRIGGELTFAGSGDSLGALIGGLAGEGRSNCAGRSTPHLDPGALTRVLARAQSRRHRHRRDQCRATTSALELDRAALPLPDGAAQATLSAGVIHVGPLAISRAGGSATASAAFDLRAQSLALDVAFAEARGGKFWSGPPPAVDVSLTGGACRADAAHRRVAARRWTCGAGDRARHRPHRGARSRHSRAGLVQPPPQGGEVHAPARSGTRGL